MGARWSVRATVIMAAMPRAPLQIVLILLVMLIVAGPSAAAGDGGAAELPSPARIAPKIIDVWQSGSRADFSSGPPPPDRGMLLRELSPEVTKELWMEDFADLERAHYEGQLVDVADDPDGLGIRLRLVGLSRIGELEDDPVRQAMLCRVSKPAAGLLYRVAERLRLIEGSAYTPLVITSLVRPWQYQQRLAQVNPNADSTRDGVPPTHVLGLAFDIARAGMSAQRERRIEALLGELARDGELAFYKEGFGGETYHVIALPSASRQLAAYWDRVSGKGEPHQVAATRPFYVPFWPEPEEIKAEEAPEGPRERHSYAPVSPCVRFGAGLEPYSAICSCEAPLNPEPSTAVADGG